MTLKVVTYHANIMGSSEEHLAGWISFFKKNRGNLRYVLRVTPEFLLTRKTHLYVIKSLQTFLLRVL